MQPSFTAYSIPVATDESWWFYVVTKPFFQHCVSLYYVKYFMLKTEYYAFFFQLFDYQ